jgi:hypothetical protein
VTVIVTEEMKTAMEILLEMMMIFLLVLDQRPFLLELIWANSILSMLKKMNAHSFAGMSDLIQIDHQEVLVVGLKL